MLVSLENQVLSDRISLENGIISIRFDDPAYVRADAVIVHSNKKTVGIAFSEGYHQICAVPHDMDFQALMAAPKAFLSAKRVDGSLLTLSAPLCVQ